MASQVFSVSRLVSAFFEIEPRGNRAPDLAEIAP
jgi:hypothetical protein